MKKLTAILLATSLLMGSIVVSAGSAGGSITPNETKILVPPSGINTMLSYQLSDSEGNSVEGANFTATGLPDGILSAGHSLIIDGTNAQSGSFTYEATGEGASAQSTISVADVRYYEDFEDGTVGASVQTAKLKKLDGTAGESLAQSTSVGVIAEDSLISGNHYASGSKGAQVVNIDLGTAAQGAKHLTIKMKIQNPVQSDAPFAITLSDSESKALVSFGARSTWNCLINYYTAEGVYTSSAIPGCGLAANTWFDVQIDLDLSETVSVTGGTRYGKYTVSVNGTPYYSNYAVRSDHTNPDAYLKTLSIGFPVDDIMIYSGKPMTTPSMTGGVPEYLTVSQDKTTVATADVVVSPFDAVPDMTSTTQGISVEDGRISIAPQTATGSTTLAASFLENSAFALSQNFGTTLSAAMEEDFEDETAGGNIISENSNLYYLGNGSWNVNASGRAVLLAKVKGTGSVSVTTDATSPAANLTDDGLWHEVMAVVDADEDSYFMAVDGVISSTGSFAGTKVTGLSVTGLAIDDIYLGNAYLAAPYVLNVKPEGKALADETLSAGYDFLSLSGETETGVSYAWYLSDSADVLGSQVSSEKDFTLETEHIGQYITLGVICSDANGTSIEHFSAPLEVKNLFTATKTATGVSLLIENTAAQATLYPMAVIYQNGVISDIRAIKVVAGAGQVPCVIPTVGDYTGAEVFVLNESFAPMSPSVVLGTIGQNVTEATGEDCFKEENGVITLSDTPVQPASLFVFKPSPVGSFENTYNISDLQSAITTQGGSIFDYLALACVVNSDACVEHNLTAAGFYRAVYILKDGSTDSLNIGIDFASLFGGDALKQSDVATFKKIIGNFSALDDATLTELYPVYQAVQNKDAVAGFMQGEDFNMDMLESSIYLSAFLEDNTYLAKTELALKEQGLNDTAVTLLAKNANRAATISQLPAPGELDAYLAAMTEKAVINGIKSAANYTEVKAYLEAVSDETISDAMALSFVGGDFNNLTEVTEAISSYQPSDSPGGNNNGVDSDRGNRGNSSSGLSSIGAGMAATSEEPTASEQTKTFSDLPSSHWAFDAVQKLVSKGILNGYGDGSFAPDQAVSRAELVKMICLAANLKGTGQTFDDVNTNDWYYSYISASAANGIVSGADGKFRPNDLIKREDAALILYRVAKMLNTEFSETETTVTDFDSVSAYAKEAVSALSGAGIITGYDDGSFKPAGHLTRAQAAVILVRTLTR